MGTIARHYFFLGIVVVLMLVPLLAKGQTVDPLEQELNALLAEIAALQQQLLNLPPEPPPVTPAPSPAPTPVSPTGLISRCPSLSRNLSRGMKGQDVLNLQVFLDQEGFFYGKPTGFFGPATEASVQEWQSAQGVIRTGTPESGFGVVGPRTRAAILNRCDPAAPTACSIAPPPTTACSTGWQAITDKSGCTTSYKCTFPLPKPTSCPQYQPLSCPNGTLVSNGTDANGCSLGARCVTVISGSCSGDVTAAQNDAMGKVCPSGGPTLLCPYDTSQIVGVTNKCVKDYLLMRGWTDISVTAQPSISISNTPLNPARGQTLTLSLNSQNAPAGAKVRLEVYKSGDSVTQGSNDRGLTNATSQLSVSGSYTWTIPSEGGAVLADAGWGGFWLTPGQYRIVAKLYTGDTCWGYCYPASTRTVLTTGEGTVFTVQ